MVIKLERDLKELFRKVEMLMIAERSFAFFYRAGKFE